MASIVPSSRSRPSIFFAKLSFIAWAFVIIWLINGMFEWTYPYCNIRDSGPAKRVYGFPLPFSKDNAGLSFSPDYMPHILLLNLTLLAALAYLLMGQVVRWISAAGTVAGVLIAAPGLLLALGVVLGVYAFEYRGSRAVVSIAGYVGSYWDYRPVGIVFDRTHYDCIPSEYWFGPIKNENLAKRTGQ